MTSQFFFFLFFFFYLFLFFFVSLHLQHGSSLPNRVRFLARPVESLVCLTDGSWAVRPRSPHPALRHGRHYPNPTGGPVHALP